MQILPCSGVRYVGEANYGQQSSGKSIVCDGESNGVGQMLDGRIEELSLNAEGPQIESMEPVNEWPISEGDQNGTLYAHCDSHDLEDNLNEQDFRMQPCLAAENSNIIVDTIESENTSNYGEGESYVSEPNWLQHDESVALWVKWRGKWQAGIRCSRADWPLSTLKGKPTHDRKKYVMIFFPHSRNYSWADVLLVRSIDDYPHPIAYKTHKIGLKMVKDLTVARRFIMQKLAVGMLNIIDQFHTEALVETARDVLVWKEFAMEASHCSGYPELGRMLLKLQNMILIRYINSDWRQRFLQPWLQRCLGAVSAESIELLKEEFYDSILWNEVRSLWDAQIQPTLGSGWKTWKHEVMKWFSTSHPISSGTVTEKRSNDGCSAINTPISRKRPKLEVRRAETHTSYVELVGLPQPMGLEMDSAFFNNIGSVNTTKSSSEVHKEKDVGEGDDWNETFVDRGNCVLALKSTMQLTPTNGLVGKKLDGSGSKGRQCTAFIESKGRQCVRWANEGDVYCCVHLASRFIGRSPNAEATLSLTVHAQMCEGTTILGTRCKHRSLPGFSFCKKHRPHIDSNNGSTSRELKHEETVPNYCKEIVLVGEVETDLQVKPLAVNSIDSNCAEILLCINGGCGEYPKRHSLYCDKHLPSWLKRARNGKSRIISKEVFMDLLKNCMSHDQKLQLHQACELFYKLFKSILSLRNPVPMDVQLQWALSEASKDFGVGEFLFKLVCREKERVATMWNLGADEDEPTSSSLPLQPTDDVNEINESSIRCKICLQDFFDDQQLGTHWMDDHKKEAQRIFKGYACAICFDSFNNKMVLETHVLERHHAQFTEECMLLQCIPCSSRFGNSEELWLHVLSVHPVEFRMSKNVQQPGTALDEDSQKSMQMNNTDDLDSLRKFICKFCGLKFDLLPDLGRHHQAAHMMPNLFSSRPPKRGIRYYAYRMKSGRLSRPKFKKSLSTTSYGIRNKIGANLKKRIEASNSFSTAGLNDHLPVDDKPSLPNLAESQCALVANTLISEIQKTKPRPNNLEILAVVRSACCKISLKASLEEKYGVLPDRIYLKAAKLCSDHNIQMEWHQEKFICPRGCRIIKDLQEQLPFVPLPDAFIRKPLADDTSEKMNNEWEVDECHYIIDLKDIIDVGLQNVTVLCSDISFGKEPIPIACVANEISLNQMLSDRFAGQITAVMPWTSFSYVTEPLLDSSLGLYDSESLQPGCACPNFTCSPATCDHVYLFDNDYEDAKDIYGKPMYGRFPYDDKGRIILEEGYLVYECNQKCRCIKTCTNRVLQNGIRVKLEVFRTEEKGWGVRAGEMILRGTFVCEYIGEVVNEQEANQRRNRYGKESINYVYSMDGHSNDMSRLIEGQVHPVIDATKHGTVSRFINHSCSPNLTNYQVLVDSMDCHRARIGLYANRDIFPGEELTHDYRYELLHPGEECPCRCGSSNCRGRLH